MWSAEYFETPYFPHQKQKPKMLFVAILKMETKEERKHLTCTIYSLVSVEKYKYTLLK